MTFLDYLIGALFLLLILIIGLKAGFKVKDTRSFAIEGIALFKQGSPCNPFRCLISAGGYTLGMSEKTFTQGVCYTFCLLGFSTQLIFVALVIVPHMEPLRKVFSIGDIMAKFYGLWGRYISGAASVLVCTGIIGAQVNAMGPCI